MSTFYDVWNQAHYQKLVQIARKTAIENKPSVVSQMVTEVPTTEDKIRMERVEFKSFGYVGFTAFGATPPIYVPKMRWTESEVEMLQKKEMSPIDEPLMRRLESEDQNIRIRAGADITQRGIALAERQDVGWEVAVMNAILTGLLPVQFEDDEDAGFTIDYGYEAAQFITVPVSWATLASSKPIDNLRAVQLFLSNTAGDYGIHFWMSSNTARGIFESAQAKELLTGSERAQYIPERADIVRRLYEPERVQFHVTDSGYRAGETYDRTRGVHTQWIPDGKVIVTTDDPFEGEPLVEVFSGRVGVPKSEFAKPALLPGPQSWVLLDTKSLTTFVHRASAKVPRINKPQCIVVMDVLGVPA